MSERPWSECYADPDHLAELLRDSGVRDVDRAARNLHDLGLNRWPSSTPEVLLEQLLPMLRRSPDPDMALTNLVRFLARTPQPWSYLEQPDSVPINDQNYPAPASTLVVLMALFGTSQYFSDVLIRQVDLAGWLRDGAVRRDPASICEECWAELAESDDPAAQTSALRMLRHREMLRIGYNDIIRGLPLEITLEDLSHLADVLVELAYRLAQRAVVRRHGRPRRLDGSEARFAVLALGKLGGVELNYSSDIDLLFLYDEDGQTDGRRGVSNAEFFARLGSELVRLLSVHTTHGVVYRVDMRLRPDGDQGPLVRSLPSTLSYYEAKGRTWERQAMIKCRAIAGDPHLGAEFLRTIEPFVYRSYLTAVEIADIRATKRRIEQRTRQAGDDDRQVKTGHGGIRDVEFVVQFLQLLHGGKHERVRVTNTLRALTELERVGCLTAEEHATLEDAYRFLRRLEHRLQTMFDRQTHQMPSEDQVDALSTLAIRMSYDLSSESVDDPEPRLALAQQFLNDYQAKTGNNRRILDHLLHDAFPDDPEGDEEPVVDLVLDPEPDPNRITAVLAPYPFDNPTRAYDNLKRLAREDIPFLPQARCEHFLAAIATRLLTAIAERPDPDLTLSRLEQVSASLGAKAILWELFSLQPQAMEMFVALCAESRFLSEVLINNPGMIDDLIDSLAQDRARPTRQIRIELEQLCQNAEDLGPIFLGFRNKEWVRIGTRDILGRDPLRTVQRQLSDVADAILGQVARSRWPGVIAQFGRPIRPVKSRRAMPTDWAILALGKLGGRELTYHSDLDLILIYESDGPVQPQPTSRARLDRSGPVFEAFARILLHELGGRPGTSGPLYRVDLRLRPHGSAGSLATPLDAFDAYFDGPARTWERLALTRARVAWASSTRFARALRQRIDAILARPSDIETLRADLLKMKLRLERQADGDDAKRGPGGIVDVEFLVQFLLLTHAHQRPGLIVPNIPQAIRGLREAGLISNEADDDLGRAYRFLRALESRQRLVFDREVAALRVPDRDEDVRRIASGLGLPRRIAERPNRAQVVEIAQAHRLRVRGWFLALIGEPS